MLTMKPPRTEESYLREANALVEDLHHHVFFKKESERKSPEKVGDREFQFHYLVYRTGMGMIGKLRTPKGLVAFLRNQLPQK